ncbi:hypothetical protein [Sneathiella sp.]|uniref:hypothetical protein n=1 Tax=Sneathiella sp. TaxID=1964365 RepID=UPI002FE316D5
MNNPSTLEVVQSMTFEQYVDYVTDAFVEFYDRAPNGDLTVGLRFWHDINVHPESAALMLPDYGY